MTIAWSQDDLRRIGNADELHIAPEAIDGTVRRDVPIWVVTVGGEVYVRTWYRRHTGWFGRAVTTRRARIRLLDLTADVAIEDVDTAGASVCRDVDTAYRAKNGNSASVDRMVSDEAAGTTLRLVRQSPADTSRHR